jgi:hypothetical protein
MKAWECAYCGMPALMETFVEGGLEMQELIAQGCTCPAVAFVKPPESGLDSRELGVDGAQLPPVDP